MWPWTRCSLVYGSKHPQACNKQSVFTYTSFLEIKGSCYQVEGPSLHACHSVDVEMRGFRCRAPKSESQRLCFCSPCHTGTTAYFLNAWLWKLTKTVCSKGFAHCLSPIKWWTVLAVLVISIQNLLSNIPTNETRPFMKRHRKWQGQQSWVVNKSSVWPQG